MVTGARRRQRDTDTVTWSVCRPGRGDPAETWDLRLKTQTGAAAGEQGNTQTLRGPAKCPLRRGHMASSPCHPSFLE